jgi:hypothetical protein
MDTYMSYDEVYKLIATYCNKMLPLFADGWSRFPEGQKAYQIENALRDQSAWWIINDNPEIGNSLKSAADEIIKRMPK